MDYCIVNYKINQYLQHGVSDKLLLEEWPIYKQMENGLFSIWKAVWLFTVAA
jgi:hypothetical protein